MTGLYRDVAGREQSNNTYTGETSEDIQPRLGGQQRDEAVPGNGLGL